ncbi:MAG: LysE family translocator [Thiotrichales bacterium]|jgi:threonine/homoserine/homoserine lactone efflux protein|nr:LysE family translocator [Thiotrichales bacterium]MBT6772217.1 LysE family translocator [Thiotrichales bacterium]MDG1870162.1 LysE family translocator [Candidatus Thioglobus sp.]|tara:strand:+ start:1383 stop:1991 length:609 start_codon:yes stop_codon:yes gene_type:complete
MEINIFIVLGFTLFIFAVTPGPGTLALLSISTSRGLASGIFFSVGMTLGDLSYLTIVIFSLNALADLIKPVTNAVQYFGACYLFYLGYSQWRAGKFNMDNNVSAQSHLRELLSGFLLAGTNPKVMIFYLSVLPSLIDLNQVSLSYGLKIVATVAISLLLGLVVIGVLGKKLRKLIRSQKMALRVNRIFGVIMIGVGFSLFYF